MAQIPGEEGPGAFCFLDNGVNMVVEVELRVQVHTKIFGRSDSLQDVAMDGVRGFDWVTLVGNTDDLTLGCVEAHQPSILPGLKSIEVPLEFSAVGWRRYVSIHHAIISKQSCCC